MCKKQELFTHFFSKQTEIVQLYMSVESMDAL